MSFHDDVVFPAALEVAQRLHREDWVAWAKTASRQELMQAEWSSLSPPDKQKAADEELTRRGDHFRYC